MTEQDKIPLRILVPWLIVDYFYIAIGRLGGLIGNVKLMDIAIAHHTYRIEQAMRMIDDRNRT